MKNIAHQESVDNTNIYISPLNIIFSPNKQIVKAMDRGDKAF